MRASAAYVKVTVIFEKRCFRWDKENFLNFVNIRCKQKSINVFLLRCQAKYSKLKVREILIVVKFGAEIRQIIHKSSWCRNFSDLIGRTECT